MTDRNRWREHQQRWEAERLKPALERSPERRPRFITQSGVEIDRVYTSEDLHDPANDPDRGRPRYAFSPGADGDEPGWDEIDDLALPGEPPFTRGIHPTGHRGRLWTMRMFAGFGTAEDTNQRFKALIAAGGTGLSIAYDTRQCPLFTLWRNPLPFEDGYVTGLEPCINLPNTKGFEKSQGRVAVLQPDETRRFDLRLEVLPTPADVTRTRQEIEALQRGATPKIFDRPQQGWSP